MKVLPFKSSPISTLGVELELQIIDPLTYDLAEKAKDLIRIISTSPYKKIIKPEVTQSMIEINSSIHSSTKDLYAELLQLQSFLISQGRLVGICISGGGTILL